jgi:hypothetical protein
MYVVCIGMRSCHAHNLELQNISSVSSLILGKYCYLRLMRLGFKPTGVKSWSCMVSSEQRTYLSEKDPSHHPTFTLD